jgi:hypothetical protein
MNNRSRRRPQNAKSTRAPIIIVFVILLLLAAGALFAINILDRPEAVSSAGDTAQGGIAPGTTIVHVTNLNDDGTGSLRDAVTLKGPRVVVFDIAGVIHLKKDLKISSPYITMAGQTAPDPGIILTGAALRIRSHDVIIQHIAIRSGPAKTAKENDNRDALSIDGSSTDEKRQSYNVRVENITAAWSVDEAVSLWFPTTREVTVTNSIIAEALNHAGHPKGAHSMGLLIGSGVAEAQITGNLLVSNAFRNPVMVQGAEAFVANNLIYNPGQNAMHFYPKQGSAPTRITLVNNVVVRGPDSKKHIAGLLIPNAFEQRDADQIYINGNYFQVGPYGTQMAINPEIQLAQTPPIMSSNWQIRRYIDVPKLVLNHAGSRPARRSKLDREIVAGVQRRQSKIIDLPPTLDNEAPVIRTAQVPADPFAIAADGQTKLARWLCKLHLEVGGMPSNNCRL